MDTLNDIFNLNGDKYRALMKNLDGFDAAAQDDVIKILLTISEMFVDNAFGMGAVDLAIKARDKLSSHEQNLCDTVLATEPAPPKSLETNLGSHSAAAPKSKQLTFEDYSP